MKKVIKRAAVLAVAVIFAAALAAPARAEMPVSWLNDLLNWYLAQNGVTGPGGPTILFLLPGSGTDIYDTPGATTPIIQVIAGNNTHYLWRQSCVYDQHTGTLHGAGSDIHYNFTQWVYTLWTNPFTLVQYSNGQVDDTLTFPVTGSPMYGQVAWMDSQSGLGEGTAKMKFTFDFYYNGWRYGGVVNNHVSGWSGEEGGSPPTTPWWVFSGTYTGLRTNVLGPLTRDGYANRGNGSYANGCDD